VLRVALVAHNHQLHPRRRALKHMVLRLQHTGIVIVTCKMSMVIILVVVVVIVVVIFFVGPIIIMIIFFGGAPPE
jgi:hypothetical protein